MVCDHARHVEVFDADVPVGASEHVSELVQTVTALGGDMRVYTSYTVFGLLPALRSLLASAQVTLRVGCAYIRRTRFSAFCQRFDPCSRRLRLRCAWASLRRLLFMWRGFGAIVPSESVARVLTPKSTPTPPLGVTGTVARIYVVHGFRPSASASILARVGSGYVARGRACDGCCSCGAGSAPSCRRREWQGS